MSGESNDQLSVIVVGELLPDKAQAFSSLLQVLAPLALYEGKQHLQSIAVVPDTQIEEVVNWLIQTVDPSNMYKVGPHPPSAVAVPVEDGGNLTCYIVIGHSNVALLSSENFMVLEAVSSILEELLHVRLYTLRWQHRQRVSRPANGQSMYPISLLKTVTGFFDEYTVARWKAPIISSMFHTEDGESARMFYGGNLVEMMKRAAAQFNDTNATLTRRAMLEPDAWNETLNTLYRYVFEPLARDAGFRAGNRDATEFPHDASESQFYREHITLYWAQIQAQIERAFDSEFKETEAALDAMTKVLMEFVAHIGITLSVTKGEVNHAYFDETVRLSGCCC